MQNLLDRAKKSGASAAAVGVSIDSGFSVDVRMGAPETVAFSDDREVSITVYCGQAKGSASTTDTSSASLDAMVAAAYEIAKVSAPDPCFGLPDPGPCVDTSLDLDLDHGWAISPSEAIEQALACEQRALSQSPLIVNSEGVSLSTYRFSMGHADSNGFSGVIHASRHNLSCSLLGKTPDSDSLQRDYEYSTARHPDDLMSWDALADSAVSRTLSRLSARKLTTRKAPVLFSSRLSASLINSFISAVSGNNLYRKNSFLNDSLGQTLFPAFIQMYERPHLIRGLGSALFDGEGVPTRANQIVKDGVLLQYVLNSYSARKLGLKTTANQGGVYNLTIDSNAGDLADLLKKMDTGLLVTELMGRGVNILTGDYSKGASGFWVEGGEIQYPVEEITIAGQLKSMFQSIVAVGSDLNPNSSTRCGSILIDEMMIAGE